MAWRRTSRSAAAVVITAAPSGVATADVQSPVDVDPSLQPASARMTVGELVPRETMERTARLIEAITGCHATALLTPSGFPNSSGNGRPAAARSRRDDALPRISVLIQPCRGCTDAQFCSDPANASGAHASPEDLASIEAAGALAWAIIPLGERRTSASADRIGESPTSERLALYLLSSAPRAWADAERQALVAIAETARAELELRRELAVSDDAREDLRAHAMRDGLTALPTRALFLDRLAHAVERAKRHPDFHFAVLSLDLDRFKAVNNSLGTEAGDAVLIEVARRLGTCVRGEDMVARSSGDEFAILLESISDHSDGGRVAERVSRALATPVVTSQGEVFTSASIGIVLSSSGLDAPPTLLQHAGIAMSRAKAAGRARYEMYDPAMQERATRRLRMETDLRRAIARSEFELYYQPLISLGSGQITELEALLRWRHPERGMIPPLDFIPLAEETGLIVPIGNWVLEEACRQMREWHQRFPAQDGSPQLSVSVNVSVKQFAQPHFVCQVAQVIAKNELDPRCLKLEITESFAIENPELTRRILEELRATGVGIYLDDFGTGYSSLAYLHQLPLDAIKIDRSFVMGMDEGTTQLQLVHTVRSLARSIGVLAVAEGVETKEQLAALRELGCESAQGYYFSRPVSATDVGELLTTNRRW